MDESDRYKLGLAVRREVLGDAHVDRALARRTRRLLALAFMVALGRDEELRMHVRAAAEQGLSADDVKEVLLSAEETLARLGGEAQSSGKPT